MTLGTRMTADRFDLTQPSPNLAAVGGAGNRFQPDGSLAGVQTKDSSNSTSITTSGGDGH